MKSVMLWTCKVCRHSCFRNQRLDVNKANGQLIQNGERHFRLYFSKDKKENECMFLSRLQPSMFTRTLQVFFVFRLSHRLLNRTNNFPDAPTSQHFLLALKAYYRLQTVSLLCNKRSTSITEPFSIVQVATKVRDICL